MPVQPIRLFGDPVLRTRARRSRLRRGAAQAGRRPDRDDARRGRRRAGRPAARRRPAGVHLLRRRRCAGHLVNPTFDAGRRGGAGGPGGLPVDPRAVAGTAGGTCTWSPAGLDMHGEPVVVEGTELLARCIQHETDHLDGVLFVDRLDPETRSGDGRDPGGRVVAAARRRRGQGQPAPAVREGPVTAAAAAAALRRHARARAVPSLRGAAGLRHEVVAVLTRPDAPAGRGRAWPARPVGALADAAGIPVLTPARPREPEFLDTLRGAGPRLLPGRRLRRAGAAGRARRAAARLGQPALLAAARLARGRAGAARDLAGDEITGATTFRLEEGLDTGPGVRRGDRGDRAHRHRR